MMMQEGKKMKSNAYEMTIEETDPKPLTDEEFAEFQKAERRKGNLIDVISSALLEVIDFFL